MLIIRLNLDSVLLFLHNSKLAYWNLEVLVFEQRDNRNFRGETSRSSAEKEPTTNLAHIWYELRNRTRATSVGCECSPPRQPCSLNLLESILLEP